MVDNISRLGPDFLDNHTRSNNLFYISTQTMLPTNTLFFRIINTV